MPFVQAKCPECGGMLAVDDNKKAEICQFCGNAFVVADAVSNCSANSPDTTKANRKKPIKPIVIVIVVMLVLGIAGGVLIANKLGKLSESSSDDTTITVQSKPILNDEGVYELCTADDLFWFAEEVNSGNTLINAALKNNIDLNNREWTPIGNYENPYRGKFNGNGYTISGLYCNVTSVDEAVAGLFGYNTGTVSSLAVSGTVRGPFAGGMVCFNDGGTVESCTNSCTVSGFEDYIGGVIAYNDAGTVRDCTNNGKVSGADYSGGVVGYNNEGTIAFCTNSGDVSGMMVGGVVGCNLAGTVESCTSTGNIIGENYASGIAGGNAGTISDCTYYTDSALNGVGNCGTHEQVNCTSCDVTSN